jgi:hypothetical protein
VLFLEKGAYMRKAAKFSQPRLTYTIFPASNGARTFWRWEVHQTGGGTVLETGALYGSKEEAKTVAEMAIVRTKHVLDRRAGDRTPLSD